MYWVLGDGGKYRDESSVKDIVLYLLNKQNIQKS
jgi:hypothetical protein